jgi:glycerate kinase
MDKFRGTASARDLCDAVARAARAANVTVDRQPMSDGGEGFRDAFSGREITVEVPGPLGETVSAGVTWRDSASGPIAVLEIAEVVGRERLVSPSREEALSASSAGVGHLVLAAQRRGAASILIGCGGSATSDAGVGCYEVLRDGGGVTVPVTVATDVTARFSGLTAYARQKGVSALDDEVLDQRVAQARALYSRERGVDVEAVERTGAAGGIPAALFALGATLTGGFDAVAQAVELEHRIRSASLVVTGEGRFDEGSLEGKVVAGVARLVGSTPLLVVCGSLERACVHRLRSHVANLNVVSLVQRFGAKQARSGVLECVEQVVAEEIDARSPSTG